MRNDLTARLAEAFGRYQNNLRALEFYRTWILPDQVRAYRGVYERHQQEPDSVGFGDVVTAQQTLAAQITSYVSALGDAWTAVVDVANLLQTSDLFGVCTEQPVAPVPELPALGCPPTVMDLLRRRRLTVARRHDLGRWLHGPQAGARIRRELDAAAPLVRWLREHVGPTRRLAT